MWSKTRLKNSNRWKESCKILIYCIIDVNLNGSFFHSGLFMTEVLPLLPRMNSDCKKYLKYHMLVKLVKEPHISTGKLLLDGCRQEYDLYQINVRTLWSFIDFKRKKFVNTGSLDHKKI